MDLRIAANLKAQPELFQMPFLKRLRTVFRAEFETPEGKILAKEMHYEITSQPGSSIPKIHYLHTSVGFKAPRSINSGKPVTPPAAKPPNTPKKVDIPDVGKQAVVHGSTPKSISVNKNLNLNKKDLASTPSPPAKTIFTKRTPPSTKASSKRKKDSDDEEEEVKKSKKPKPARKQKATLPPDPRNDPYPADKYVARFSISFDHLGLLIARKSGTCVRTTA
jgi:hypothetical protein